MPEAASPSSNSSTKPSVIAVVNQKGGVGKTTTAINLAAAVAMQGYKTLLIDCDPQANTTAGLGVARDEDRLSVYDLLVAQAAATDVIIPTEIENLSLVPGTKNMIGANVELVSAEKREFRLREALAPVRGEYRFIFLDCPPALDLLTLNSLVAADRLLVPMQAEYFALEGISELISTLDKVSAVFNPELGLEGVLLTMFDERTNLSQQVRDNLRSFFGDKLFTTTIPRNIRLAEAPSHGKPVLVYDPRSRGAEAYQELAGEFLRRHGLALKGAKPKKPVEEVDIPERPILSTPKSRRVWPFSRES